MARLWLSDFFTTPPQPTNATGQLLKVSRIFCNSKSTEDKLKHLNNDGGVWVILSGK